MIRRGLVTRAELRGKLWHPLFRDVFADGQIELTHRLSCRAAASFLLPDGAVIAGRSAAALHGVPLRGPDDEVEVLSPRRFGPFAGLIIHTGELADSERTVRHRVAVTTPLRTCWDLASWLDIVEAVVFIDALASRRLVTRKALAAYAGERMGMRGSLPFTRAVELMDAASESPAESRLRVRLVLAGVPKPMAQYVVTDNVGGFIARVDLGLPEWKIAVEYDGRWHGGQLEHDRARLNRLVAAGWIVFHVTAQQMRDKSSFDSLVAQVASAIKRQGGGRRLGRRAR